MHLNTIKPAVGAKQARVRVGRGVGSGLGKTCGKGHKGQKARSGNKGVSIGFEGGQMPIQRRLPKMGFRSRKARYSVELRLHEIVGLSGQDITLEVLKDYAIVPQQTKKVKIIKSGEISVPVTLKGLAVTKGAQTLIEAAGGKVEDND